MQELTNSPSAVSLWTGRVLSSLCILFLLLDGFVKVLQLEPVMQECTKLGILPAVVPGIGILLMVCALIYAVPQTAPVGAVLLTGYLGGAIATHVRMGGPLFPIVFASTFGVLVWLGLYLRDARVQCLFSLT